MDKIIIADLEVSFRVGVPDEERAKAQRLLVTLELGQDFRAAARSDDLRTTIDYYAVSQRVKKFGEGREWRLIEKLATDLAELVLREFHAISVLVRVKKFILPDTKYVAVEIVRPMTEQPVIHHKSGMSTPI